jgi:hypothetical protein
MKLCRSQRFAVLGPPNGAERKSASLCQPLEASLACSVLICPKALNLYRTSRLVQLQLS